MPRSSSTRNGKSVGVELECDLCQAHETVVLSPRKFKILSSTWHLDRECAECGRTTLWRFAEAAVSDNEQVNFWDWLAATGEFFVPSGAEPQHERRKERRVGLNVPLRIARLGGPEESVISENISRSGLCFTSSGPYTVGETIQVTLRPAGAAVPVIQSATIVRVSPATDGKLFCGARLEPRAV